MSLAAEPGLRVVSFADLEGRLWGAAFDAGHAAALAGTADGRPAAGPATITAADDGAWLVSADWLNLSVSAPCRQR